MMSNLDELKKLVDEGKYLDEQKISRETEEISKSTFDYHRKITVYDVDKERYKEWDKKVIAFLGNLHLQEFIELSLDVSIYLFTLNQLLIAEF